jgi:hypothetical protein
MSETSKFTIRRLTPETPAGETQDKPDSSTPKPPQKLQKSPPKTPTKKKEPSPALETESGGHFASANSALAFLGSVFGARLSDTAAVRRTSQGTWWVEIALSYQRIAPLIWTAGGRPFAYHNQQWVALSQTGDLPGEHQAKETLEVNTGSIVELAELLAEASLPPSRYREATVLDIVTPGKLGRWILRRATALGLEVTITPALQQPLNQNNSETSGVLLMRLQSKKGRSIPGALVYRLSNLPYTTVAVPSAETERQSLLVDVRHRLPLAASLIEPMIPEGEIWLLGTREVNNWRLRLTGNQVDGALLLDAPQLPKIEIPSLSSGQIPKPIAVQLVSRPQASQQADAVLLDDTELSWVRSLLMGRPIGEMTFLLLGTQYHLLTAPGGLPTQIPLGIPLVWVGPNALYLELGMDFYPPLPKSARQQRFNLNSQTAVVVARHHTYLFDTAHITPAWTLWVGEVPPVEKGLSGQGKQLLNQISQQLRQVESKPGLRILRQPKQVKESEEVGLLEQAQKAELTGDLVKAAALLEKGGYSAQAGRLYERIAKMRGW